MHWLLLGSGSIGRRHTKNIQTLFPTHRITVFDPNPANVALLSSLANIECTSKEDALDNLTPDITVICSPNHLHIPQAIHWAKKGSHLFIEKPLSHTLDDIPTLTDILNDQKKMAMVACNMRFFPNIHKVKTLLNNHAVGEIYTVQVESGHYFPDWRPHLDYRENYGAKEAEGGGVILDIIHEIDLLKWYGGPVTSVFAMSDKVSTLDIETEDVASIICRFKAGGFGEAHLDYLQHAYSRRCKIIGATGVIHWDMETGITRLFKQETKTWETVYTLPEDYDLNTMYLEELMHFFSAIQGKVACINPLAEAWKTLKLALAIKLSAIEEYPVPIDF